MSDGPAARLPKWPFYLADGVLSAITLFVLYRLGRIEGVAETVLAVTALGTAALGAWISISPWLTEYRDSAKQSEAETLNSSLDQIKDLQQVAQLIGNANSQWQTVQDSATRTVNAAREISDRMKTETDDFMKFLQNANDQEKTHLRLEVEKLRRTEGDWLQVVVRILDHVFALHQAAIRSGQQQLINQIEQFQFACRDAARRIGLNHFAPAPGEPFDERGHQLADPNVTAPAGAQVGQLLATGYTYQGQLLRRALVALAPPETATATEDVVTEEGAPEAQLPLV